MKRIKITAFWDMLIGSIVCSILFTVAIYIFIVVKGDKGWNDISWYHALICAICVAVPVTIMLSLQKMTIDSIEIVKLSNEEKRKYTSAKFLFSKYLKINLKYGHCKYVYVSHYSNSQIRKIKKMLTKK